MPADLHQLGLPQSELARHIGWDIGAAAITEILSERFDSPVIFCGTSRLVIDCNRQLDAYDLIPEESDGTVIPGNQNLSDSDKQGRVKNYFEPYHQAIEEVILRRENPIFVSVHSMTESMRGVFRPWPISLSSYEDRSLVEPLLEALRFSDEFLVGDNQPYDLDPKVDYSTPFHALRRGLRHLQVEFRQDGVASAAGQKLWAGRFGDAIERAGLLRARLG